MTADSFIPLFKRGIFAIPPGQITCYFSNKHKLIKKHCIFSQFMVLCLYVFQCKTKEGDNLKVIENHLGEIIITDQYVKSLVSQCVVECIGVAGLECVGLKQSLKKLLKLTDKNTGVKITSDKNGDLIIDLHITATYGTNISAVANSIEEKVKYALLSETHISVLKINTFVDELKA